MMSEYPMQRIYLSGPITGIADHNRPAFVRAAAIVEDMGHLPINPLDLTHDHDGSWAAYMRVDLAALLTCDAVLMLPGWSQSRGALLERRVALEIKLPVSYLREGLVTDEAGDVP